MLLLTLAAAGLMVGPEPDPKRIVNTNNYPAAMVQANKSIFAEIAAVINPDGEIERCGVLTFIGDAQFAKGVCGLLDKHMWNKSLDTEGRPIYALIKTGLKFSIPSTRVGREVQSAKQHADLQLPFPYEWRGRADEVDVPLSALIGDDGHVEACRFQPAPLTKKDARDLADLACESIGRQSFGPIPTNKGSITRYVVTENIRFSRSISGRPIGGSNP
ncbi:MAG: hypothetical protein ABIP41_02975 [Croceibacterium sp.]